jgi:hypothetical protein
LSSVASGGGSYCQGSDVPGTMGHNGAIAAHHAKGSGSISVAFGFVEAYKGAVDTIWSDAVCPIVIYLASLNRHMMCGGLCCCRRGGDKCGCNGRWGAVNSEKGCACGVVGSMKASLACSQMEEAFLANEDKVSFESCNTKLVYRLYRILLGGGGKKISPFNHH